MATDNYGNELDLEYVYPPKSERVICAGDERHAALEARVKAFEYLDGLTAGYLLRAEEYRRSMQIWREEVERLRTFKAGVPWEAIRTLRWWADGDEFAEHDDGELDAVDSWLAANAPEEETE